jgi:dolichol kinase
MSCLINLKELPRRSFHILGGLSLPILGLLLPQNIFLPGLITVTLAFLIFELVRLNLPSLNRRFCARFKALLREREASTLTTSSYLLAAAAIVFVLCPHNIAIMALTLLAVGDPTAGIVGERWGRTKVRGKSLTGSIACLGICIVASIILPSFTHITLWLALVGAVCATITEFLSLPPNDNFTIPLVSAGVMTVVKFVLIA